MQYKIVSPDWLADNNYRSIANDKKIGVLKPGTIVYNSPRRDLEDSNWIGATISCFGKKHKITDVVYSTTSFDECTKFYIVADKNATYYNFSTYDLYCIVKKGHTKEQFISELKNLYPDKRIKWNPDYVEDKAMVVIAIICLMLLGSSVLIIGMSGYLKMQLQLFLLRSREMALRRCNGAKPFQLFMLLCYELLIVFGFTAVISILFSIALADHSIPLMQKLGARLMIYPQLIYDTELYIVIATLLCAIGIAWIVVRKTLKSPLSQTVGRSFTQRTLWNGAMQVVQYLVTIILFFAIILTFTCMSEAIGQYKKNIDPDYFKSVLCVSLPLTTDSIRNEIDKEAKKLPSIEKKAFYRFIHASILIKEDSISNSIKHVQEDSTRYFYGYVIDTEYLSMFKHEITEKIDSGEGIHTVPVFASKEEADSIKHLLSLKYSTSDEETQLPDGNKYVRIGYTDDTSKRIGVYHNTHFYIIKDVDKYSANGENVKAEVDDSDRRMYVIPKNNDVNLFSKEYDALCHKHLPNLPSDFHYPANSVYDLDFIDDQIIRFVGELISILTAISILCIILTVYSSISLETRGKQKEVAIRKVNGAKTRDIVMLFSRYYIVTLCTAYVLSLLIGVALIFVICITANGLHGWTSEETRVCITCYLESIATITLVTLLTVWQKIYKISHINPALLIKKE
jgi:ABC-type antimicrobial peptide transport system permease subunit